jgi:hypothetical protein
MTTTYRTMTGEQARAAGAAPDLIDYPLTLDADRDAYEPDRRGVFRLADGRPVELLGTDGGEPEDQTLGRDWSWVAGALSDAHVRGVNAGLQQADDGHVDTLNAITEAAGPEWDGEEAIDDIAVRYVAHLVAEVRRLGGRLHPSDPEIITRGNQRWAHWSDECPHDQMVDPHAHLLREDGTVGVVIERLPLGSDQELTPVTVVDLVKVADVMCRCAQAMNADTSMFASSHTGNGDCNAFEAAGPLEEVAEALAIPGPHMHEGCGELTDAGQVLCMLPAPGGPIVLKPLGQGR